MKTSKILSMILALAMVFAIALPMTAFAAGTDTITVNSPASLPIVNTDFTAYKIFNVSMSLTSSSTVDPATSYVYTPTTETTAFLAWATAHYAAMTPTQTSPYGTDANALLAYLRNASANLTQFTTDVIASGDFARITPPAQVSATSVKFSNLDDGYYLVAGMGTAPGGVKVVARNALVTVDSEEKDATINLKADAPSITKEVYNDGTSGETAGWDNHTDASISDVVNFRLTSKVPDMTGYASYQFTIRDIMSPGLTLRSDIPVAVSVGGTAYANTNYTLTTTPITAANLSTIPGAVAADVGGTYIEIKFDPAKFITLAKDAAIQVLYSAELNKDAVMAPGNNPNTVWLTYSNNPSTTGTGDTPHTTVYVYTFQIDVNKVDGNTDKGLGDAVFNLRTTSGSDSSALKLISVSAGDSTNPAVYRVPTAAELLDSGVTKTTDITTPDSGLVQIKGLDTGTYWLYEKTAPDGYTKLTAEKQVNVTATYSADGATVTNTGSGASASFVIPEEQVQN